MKRWKKNSDRTSNLLYLLEWTAHFFSDLYVWLNQWICMFGVSIPDNRTIQLLFVLQSLAKFGTLNDANCIRTVHRTSNWNLFDDKYRDDEIILFYILIRSDDSRFSMLFLNAKNKNYAVFITGSIFCHYLRLDSIVQNCKTMELTQSTLITYHNWTNHFNDNRFYRTHWFQNSKC